MALTAKTLIRCGVPADIAYAQLPHMVRAMRAHGITTRPRARAFLATVLHESLGLRAMNEIGGGRKYEGRGGLGNKHAGDGERFKGRGPIQLTGRSNYAAYGRMLGLDLVGHPELVARPEVGWRVAACFFQKRSGVLAAADARNFRRVTLLINGGYNGWEDRERYWRKLATLGVVPGTPKLKRGAQGHEVEVLTRRLTRVTSKKTGKPFLSGARAKFDLRTARALRAFQREHGLKVDGVLGSHSAAALSRAVKAQRAVAHPKVTAAPVAAANGKPHHNGAGHRDARLWQRLERLDRDSDRVRAELRSVGPPALETADGLSDAQLVEVLGRTDTQSDVLRKALATRVSRKATTPEPEDPLVTLSRELTALSQRLSHVADEHANAAPAVPAMATVANGSGNGAAAAPAAVETIDQLEALEAEADTLRATLERTLLGDPEPTPAPAHAETSRYLELLARLDALDAESDTTRAALRPAAGTARTFRLRSPEMRGEDVHRWQLFLNRCLHRWGVEHRVAVDAEYGKETARWTKRVLHGLGLSIADWKGLTPQARVKARHPETLTAAERTAAHARSAWRERLRRGHPVRKGGKHAAVAYAKRHADRRTAETRVNGGPFIDDWCRLVHLQPGTPAAHWCGAFVNACLVKAGMPSRDWLCSTPKIVHNAKAGVEGWSWHTRPRVGDLVLFNWPGGDFVDHVGLVVQVNADRSVKTVEGNFQDRVGYWQRKSQILGYARPPWS